MLPEILGGRRVLLVEDDLASQIVETQMLELLGAETVLAKTGLEALALATEARFDLFLLDIHLPGLSGLELIRALRGQAGSSGRTPIVAVTAHTLPHQCEQLRAAGVLEIIAKPIDSIETFARQIASALDRVSPPSPAPPTREAVAPGGDAPALPPLSSGVLQSLEDALGHAKLCEILRGAASELQATQDRLLRALESGNRQELRAALHVMRSVATMLGARELAERVDRLSGAADSEEAARLRREAVAVQQAIDRLRLSIGSDLAR